MRKITSLAVVLILVLCLATTAFAADQSYPVTNPMMLPTSIELAAGETATLEISFQGLDNTVLKVTGANSEVAVENMMGTTPCATVDGVAQAPIKIAMFCNVTIKNVGTETVTYMLEVVQPAGTMSNPDTLVLGTATAAASAEGYFYNYTAADYGVLVLEMTGDNWVVTINNLTTGVYGDAVFASDGANAAAAAIAPNDELQIIFGTEDFSNADISFKAEEVAHLVEHFEANEASCHERGNVEYWYCAYCESFYLDEACTRLTNAMSIWIGETGSENVKHFEAVEAGCHNNGNVEHWYCEDCDCYFLDEACTQLSNALSIITPATGATKVEHIEAVEAGCHNSGNIEHWICEDCGGLFEDADCTIEILPANRVILPATGPVNVTHVTKVEPECHVNGMEEHWYCADCNGYFTDKETTQQTNPMFLLIPAEVTMEYYEGVEAGCHSNGNVEHWYCPECDGFYLDPFGRYVTNSLSVTLPATGSENVVHNEKSEPYCHVNGMEEHWYCEDCGGYFTDAETTHQAFPWELVIPAEVTLEYHEEEPATCVKDGMAEYWYCEKCDCYFTDYEGKMNIARLRLVLLADGTAHNLEHHEAADPVCHRNGNVEYWYCGECDCYFIDVEGNLVNTNAKNVVILAENQLTHNKKVEATCDKDGMDEHWYCEKCDCYFTDAEGIFNIASKRLVLLATGHDYVDGKCTVCGNDNPATGDAGTLGAIATLLASAMSTVALVIKKKEF